MVWCHNNAKWLTQKNWFREWGHWCGNVWWCVSEALEEFSWELRQNDHGNAIIEGCACEVPGRDTNNWESEAIHVVSCQITRLHFINALRLCGRLSFKVSFTWWVNFKAVQHSCCSVGIAGCFYQGLQRELGTTKQLGKIWNFYSCPEKEHS